MAAIIFATMLNFRGNGGVASDDDSSGRTTSGVRYSAPLNVLWVGDSFPAGTGTLLGNSKQSEATLTANAMGWRLALDAEGATGFLNDGHVNSKTFTTLGKRLPDDAKRYLADVVVIDAGRNDSYFPTLWLKPAVAKYLRQVHRFYPKAKIVAITPYSMSSKTGSTTGAVVNQEVRRAGGLVIDPFVQGRIGGEQPEDLVASDGQHPNPDGHRYVAQHLTAALKKLGFTQSKVPS